MTRRHWRSSRRARALTSRRGELRSVGSIPIWIKNARIYFFSSTQAECADGDSINTESIFENLDELGDSYEWQLANVPDGYYEWAPRSMTCSRSRATAARA